MEGYLFVRRGGDWGYRIGHCSFRSSEANTFLWPRSHATLRPSGGMPDFGMLDDESTVRVRSLWRELMLAPDGFLEPGWVVVASPGHRAAPDGWVGIVEILDSVVIAAPDELVAALTGRTEGAPPTSGVWLALDDHGRPAALSGWREWPQQVAHMSIITASTHRGMGLGTDGARAALVAARDAGLLPQWRAAETNVASVELANRLGLQRVGRQVSIRVGVDAYPSL